ncbi:ABC transporter substrate-binding protein [Pseudaminobacter sp. 19-2017]|uniref:ABC transporter substrate-binding protein n=1 Tax=Pseudaminobacter soli (ex Zhang et al. 2022) TaxID=2831468 RepID=A0A942E2H1_9HYPH|nr:ABC transporter substrate-binding protein [Pseudaminobacter soli]MBS3649811.1 ABC transporter substrate-binding protein [Pseudaminobacter soli]
MSYRIDRRQFAKLAAAVAAGAVLSNTAGAAEAFRLGALNSITGAGGAYGPGMLEAIQIAVAEVNAAGGAAGRQFELFAEDDQTKPDAAVLAVKKLVEINRVEAVVGIWPSSVQLATLPITNAANVPSFNVCGAPELETLDDKDLVFQFYASNKVIGAVFAEVAKKRGFKNPAVLAYNNATMVAQAENFRSTWEAGGGEVADFIVYEPNQTSYRTELDRALSKNPDILVLSSYTPDVTIILKEWYQSGYDCKLISPGWSITQAVADALGPEVSAQATTISNVPASSTEAYKAFHEAFVARTGRQPEMFATAAYDMVIVLALAIELAGASAKGTEISAKIRNVTNAPGNKVSTFAEGLAALKRGEEIDYEGASSPLEFGEAGQTTPAFGIFGFEDNKLALQEVMTLKS